MIEQIITDGSWLAYVFAFLIALSMLVYSILDGYDLGIGILTINGSWREKDNMIASIGPFWDANETWLILGVGLLLVAFPSAHSVILHQLYLPVAIMLFGIIFRGVAFDFRAKVPYQEKRRWDNKFFYGSLLTSLSQGYMLGSYITGFNNSLSGIMFSCLIATSLTSAYILIGSCWLIIKCDSTLQKKAISWAKCHLINSTIGLIAISLVTPLISDRIFNKWFAFPKFIALAPIPITTAILICSLYMLLRKMPFKQDKYCWLPFMLTVGIYIFSFLGLAYSFFPYIVPEQITIVEAAASTETLMMIFIGTIIVFPLMLAYTALAYYVFRGKATELRYD